MKKLLTMLAAFLLVASMLQAQKLKIDSDNVLFVKISNEQPTVMNFNFFVKKVKKILTSKNKTAVKLLDKGVVIIPDRKDTKGTIVVTNEQGTSYVINFKADKDGDSVCKIDDISYSKAKPSKLNLETQDIDRDISNIIKKLDNMNGEYKLNGFETTSDNFTIYNKDKTFSMTRVLRFSGKKYVVDSWIIKNISKSPLVFDNKSFATKGVIAASIKPKYVYPGETASLYIFNNRAELLKSE